MTSPAEIKTAAAVNSLKSLPGCGQSVGLDYTRRSLISSGELARLIEHDGLRGVTSNPAIFEKAITGSTGYTKFTFGVVKAAQARGDFEVLAERKRRALRVHLSDVSAGLNTLKTAIAKALV